MADASPGYWTIRLPKPSATGLLWLAVMGLGLVVARDHRAGPVPPPAPIPAPTPAPPAAFTTHHAG